MEIKVIIDVTPELKEILETIAETNKNLKEVVSDLTKAGEAKMKLDESLENGLDKKEAKKQAKKKSDEDEGTFDLDSDVLDLTKDDPEMSDEDEETEEKPKAKPKKEEPVKKAASKVSQKDVIKAFQAFAAKKGKEPAIKILKQYKVKKVVDISPDDFEGVMKLLSK
jgi:hypothetical protein